MKSTVSRLAIGVALLSSGPLGADTWEDRTAETIGTTGGWSNKVELADINADGRVDILFANGGNYSSAGSPQVNQVFVNLGGGAFSEATEATFGEVGDLARVIKARDLDGDHDIDLLVGTTYQTQSRLFHKTAQGVFTEVTSTHLPQAVASVGDIAVGDVDGDGDLDLAIADWGPGNPLSNNGGRTRLWLNDGDGSFSDASAEQMPDILVKFSWDLEFVDVDNDFDLDILVACKSCDGSFLFKNDGTGSFTNDPLGLPQFANNYEFEAMDLNRDGYMDLITINDGPSLSEHIFMGGSDGRFVDKTAELWPAEQNLGFDDNVVAFLDVDSDGDADFLIGSLDGNERLMRNNGSGGLTAEDTMTGIATPGTLGLAVADLNGDGRLDVVQSQGEVADPDKVFFGVDIAPDTTEPFIGVVDFPPTISAGSPLTVRARIHDYKSPNVAHDWDGRIEVHWSVDGGDQQAEEMRWYGENLWRAQWTPSVRSGQSIELEILAVDAAGNTSFTFEEVTVGDPGDLDAGVDDRSDAGTGNGDDSGGCGCRASDDSPLVPSLLIVAFLAFCNRRSQRSRA